MAMYRVCAVQMRVGTKTSENLPRIINLIQRSESDFVLFPEMSLTGYRGEFSQTKAAEAWDAIADACRKAYCTAIVGTGAVEDGHRYIQSRVYSHEGDFLGAQEKLVPTASDRAWCRPGSELHVFTHRGLTFGCLMSNDFWVTPGLGPYPDPRLTYQVSERGARVIFLSLHTGADPKYRTWHEVNLSLRAQESGCYVVTANAASANGPVNTPTGIMNPSGEWVQTAPPRDEQILHFDLDLPDVEADA